MSRAVRNTYLNLKGNRYYKVENEAKRKLSKRAVQKLVDEAKYRAMQEGVEWEKAENLDKKTTEK